MSGRISYYFEFSCSFDSKGAIATVFSGKFEGVTDFYYISSLFFLASSIILSTWFFSVFYLVSWPNWLSTYYLLNLLPVVDRVMSSSCPWTICLSWQQRYMHTMATAMMMRPAMVPRIIKTRAPLVIDLAVFSKHSLSLGSQCLDLSLLRNFLVLCCSRRVSGICCTLFCSYYYSTSCMWVKFSNLLR